jgi:hypothetical protein
MEDLHWGFIPNPFHPQSRIPINKMREHRSEKLLVTQSYTEKSQRPTELRSQISVGLCGFSVALCVSFKNYLSFCLLL